ncbi:hypothetical protein [Halarcobacter sp.]|uniref:hypothetical protein n=1 Tax=Halarcobacter sp. TaxID=2321133 RepID=UPI002AA6361E|nr:hypothetical protein [Halarcobacter sp.]
MILIGDNLIPHKACFFIDSIMDIEHTEPNSTLIFNYDENLLLYCRKNHISCAVVISSIKEAIYCNALNSKYIICDRKIAKNIQKIAENYMFDSKILAIIESDDEIEKIALSEIDGAIYSYLLNK